MSQPPPPPPVAGTADIGALYRDYRPWLYQLLRLWIHDDATIEDLLQDVFAGMVRTLKFVGAPRQMRVMLYQMARHHAMNWLRKRRTEARHHRQFVALRPAATTADHEVGKAVMRAVAALDANGRDIVMLHVFHDLSFNDIAEVLAIPATTAHARYQKACAALQGTLKGEWDA